jgi:hypothetical protein
MENKEDKTLVLKTGSHERKSHNDVLLGSASKLTEQDDRRNKSGSDVKMINTPEHNIATFP